MKTLKSSCNCRLTISGWKGLELWENIFERPDGASWGPGGGGGGGGGVNGSILSFHCCNLSLCFLLSFPLFFVTSPRPCALLELEFFPSRTSLVIVLMMMIILSFTLLFNFMIKNP